MSPGNARLGTSFSDDSREHSVAEEALRLLLLAGVHVGLAGVASGVDQKLGPIGAERGGEHGHVGVIEFGAAEVFEGDVFSTQEGLIGLADIAGTAEEVDHGDDVEILAGKTGTLT
jgi:hypothetical protein